MLTYLMYHNLVSSIRISLGSTDQSFVLRRLLAVVIQLLWLTQF